MEGNCRRETTPPALSRESTRPNSDASPLAAGDWTDSLMRDDSTAWNDEKHNLYIRQLEASFVKQLHHSKCLLAQCSEQIPRGNVNNASEQFNVLWNGCWQKINCVRGEPLPGSISVDSGTLMSEGVYDILRSDELSPNKPPPEDVLDLTREGTGQNFLDEGDQMPSNFESQAKRLKTV